MQSPRSPVYGETLACRGLPPSIFQSVIACVPTGWSHLWDCSTTPIYIYYGPMIDMEGMLPPKPDVRRNPRCATRQSPTARQQSMLHDNGWQHGKAHGKVRVARQSLCRAFLARRTTKIALPDQTLPCGLCRALTHGKAFAMHEVAFAMQLAGTAMWPFPVVKIWEKVGEKWGLISPIH
jgi:hypothetical protein